MADINNSGLERRKRWRKANPEWCRERWLRWSNKSKDKIRNKDLKAKYGITQEDYDRMLVEQHGGCTICGSPSPGPGLKNFSVDHDHETGKVRGLLCNPCNRGLGHFNDNPAACYRAEQYLLNHRS